VSGIDIAANSTVLGGFVTELQRTTVAISGLDCIDCARALEGGVAQLDGVELAELNFAASTLTVGFHSERIAVGDVIARIREMGYDVQTPSSSVFAVSGLDCADCAAKLERAISAIPTVQEARVSFATAELHVVSFPTEDVTAEVIRRAAALGYPVRLSGHPSAVSAEGQESWRGWLRAHRRAGLTMLSGLFLAVAMLLRLIKVQGPAPALAYGLAILTGGYHVARSGWAVLRTTHSLDMNALMSIAAIGAVAIGEWAEGATAMFLFSLGNTLEAMTMDRARQAIRKLMELSPSEARRVHEEHADIVPVEQLRVGDTIEVRPGEKIPMDGAVIQGRSDVNQAPITGESAPVDVEPSGQVFAGSINGRGRLLIRVARLAGDNTLARIVQMVQQAQAQRAPSQRFVDSFARYYTPAVIALAAGMALLPTLLLGQPLQPWLYRALVMLVIACPCALVISTPVAIVSAISSAARRGVLIKGGAHLEAMGRVRVMAFDKTGTLTEGRAVVTDVEWLVGQRDIAADGNALEDDDNGLLSLAATIETHSSHPVARAITAEALARDLRLVPISDYTEIPGFGAEARLNGETYYVGKHGLFCERVPHTHDVCARAEAVEAEGKTVVLVSNSRKVLGLIAVADRVRESAAQVVTTLRSMGIEEIVLLTGDNERTARAIGAQTGIQMVKAGLLPEDKVLAVEEMLDGRTVAMVGDGVNDAPALATATVGIAMGAAGSDAALETADVVLMSDDLGRIPYAVRLGRRTLANIRQNVALSLVIKGIFVLLALVGAATLWMAVFADMGTSLIVTLNGMRLLREG